jgi:hypothetical protein
VPVPDDTCLSIARSASGLRAERNGLPRSERLPSRAVDISFLFLLLVVLSPCPQHNTPFKTQHNEYAFESRPFTLSLTHFLIFPFMFPFPYFSGLALSDNTTDAKLTRGIRTSSHFPSFIFPFICFYSLYSISITGILEVASMIQILEIACMYIRRPSSSKRVSNRL